jgi:hypothetical protein
MNTQQRLHAQFRKQGFTEEWTGGNCRAWKKDIGAYSLWISDEDAGLGDSFDESYGLVIEAKDVDHNEPLALASGDFHTVMRFAREAVADMGAFIAAHPASGDPNA